MPYDPESGAEVTKMKNKLEKTYSSVSDTAARQAIHILNSMLGSGKEEGAAWGAIHSKMKERGLSKKAELSDELERIAAKHPKHAEALEAIAKEAYVADLAKAHKLVKAAGELLDKAGRIKLPDRTLEGEINHAAEIVWNVESQVNAAVGIARTAAGWVPGELREDKIWETGEVDNTPFAHKEEGSQVPPARTNDGVQLDEAGNPVESIPRVPKKAGFWDDDDIIEYYDANPDATLRDVARMTGRTVAELKRLLMPGRRADTVEESWGKLAKRVRGE